jgi:hypothetical protein
VVFDKGFKFDLSVAPQIPIGNGSEQELDGLPQRIFPILHCSFL